MMGLEEHLLGMFRDDFEFHDGAAPSHLGRQAAPAAEPQAVVARRRRCRRCRRLGGRRREGTPQDPVLRARQGAPQHRALRHERGMATDHHRDACTMPKRISAADAVRRCASSIVTHGQPSGRRGRAGASARCARDLPGLQLVRCTPRPNGARDPACARRAARPTSRRATSSSPPCCSWTTISAPCCRRCRRAATTATPWSAACRRARSMQADPHRPLQHGRRRERRPRLPEAAARQAQGRRQRPAPSR